MYKEYILYVLIDPITNQIRYVGQTSMTLKRRLTCHISKKEKTHKKYWINSLIKNGLKPIIKEVAKFNTQEEVNLEEIKLIKKLREDKVDLTNIADGGNVTSGYKFTEEQKNKMMGRKPHNLGKPRSIDEKNKISKSLRDFFKKNPKIGIPHTKESKRKIGDRNSKKVALIDEKKNIIEIFNSVREASFKLNLNETSISKVCLGKRNSLFGKKFIYL